jgi:hypothetical protein
MLQQLIEKCHPIFTSAAFYGTSPCPNWASGHQAEAWLCTAGYRLWKPECRVHLPMTSHTPLCSGLDHLLCSLSLCLLLFSTQAGSRLCIRSGEVCEGLLAVVYKDDRVRGPTLGWCPQVGVGTELSLWGPQDGSGKSLRVHQGSWDSKF